MRDEQHTRDPAAARARGKPGHTDGMHVLAAPDKFRGSASAVLIADAIARAASESGWECDRVPISDGGEGLLECFAGPNRESTVTGPSGRPVRAAWRSDGSLAVIEMARASGQSVAGPDHDPVAATTRGTGELIAAALDAGAQQVIVGAGGSATTDGGSGAVQVLRNRGPLDGSSGALVRVACDVTTAFLDAARVFAPQKGATPEQVRTLTDRLREHAEDYREQFGVDVTTLAGAGAAGGLAGGLAALGARIERGFDVVAEQVQLADRIRAADLVVTGEGRLDATSSAGKAVGSLTELCAALGTPARIVAGTVGADADPRLAELATDLRARFGSRAAWTRPDSCVRAAVAALLRRECPPSGAGCDWDS
ncbi:MAG TPA: glycerate kinase [Jatrophihabitantaceae bacterium]|nr:glycerate kinase [Jatrophihabitantaceae bacterium]